MGDVRYVFLDDFDTYLEKRKEGRVAGVFVMYNRIVSYSMSTKAMQGRDQSINE